MIKEMILHDVNIYCTLIRFHLFLAQCVNPYESYCLPAFTAAVTLVWTPDLMELNNEVTGNTDFINGTSGCAIPFPNDNKLLELTFCNSCCCFCCGGGGFGGFIEVLLISVGV